MKRKRLLACRVREIRNYLYGENGLDALAQALGVPTQTWLNYERGITMPAEVLLNFLEATGVDPHWLSTGEGERLKEVARGYGSECRCQKGSQAGGIRYEFVPPPVGPN
jgi:Bacteriophage CI repressor helix-turn-helix domain